MVAPRDYHVAWEVRMILVVDDDASIANLLKTALEVEGYRVVTAADGVQAYQAVKSPQCRCMVLDVLMPRINGIELLMLIQAENIQVPTIVMAGFGDFQEVELKEFSNVVKFLHKPFDLDVLLQAVRKHMRQ
jgi:DNA-binding NtrC family response regulator